MQKVEGDILQVTLPLWGDNLHRNIFVFGLSLYNIATLLNAWCETEAVCCAMAPLIRLDCGGGRGILIKRKRSAPLIPQLLNCSNERTKR